MPKILCIANQSAGVGKTTTSVNLAIGLAHAGQRCLVVDLDPRACLSHQLTSASESAGPTRTYVPDCYVMQGADPEQARSTELVAEAFAQLKQSESFDYVVLDCPPTTEASTAWALRAANELIMPLRCDEFGLDGVPEFVRTLKAAIGDGSEIEFKGVVLTHREPSRQSEEIEEEAREFFGDVMFDTVVPEDPQIEKTRRSNKALMDVAPRSRGARAYLELCREVLER